MSQKLTKLFSQQVLTVLLAVIVISGISFYAGNNQRGSDAAAKNSGVTPKSLYLYPSSGTMTAGSVVTTTIYEDSATVPVNVVQAALTYPADKLAFMSLGEGTTFTNIASTDTATPGLIRLARALPADATAGISGKQKVTAVNFRVLPGASGTANLGFDLNSSFLVSSANNTNIISTTGGASYRIGL